MKSLVRKVTSAAISFSMLLTSVPVVGMVSSAETASASASTTLGAGGVPKGFVYTDGTKFKCNGSNYYYGGTNCYYLIYKEKDAVDNVLDDCKNMGLNVIRTWGNLDVGTKADNFSESNPVFNNSRDGVGQKDGVYFQYFDKEKGEPVVNEGANGLQRLDYVIAEAEKRNLKLIITFTNYWEAFGGMDQYCLWMKEAGKGEFKRNAFYTNETMKKWYKNYVNTLLNHENVYTGKKLKDSEGVFAWELCNEPRVDSSFGDSNNENETDMGCKKDILYNWAKEMSEYVKSVDPYHLVSVGDEGFYNYGKTTEEINEIGVDSYFAFTGDAGVDFDKLMSIDTIDFGTPHMYCDQWNMAWKPDSQGIGSQINNGKDDDMDWLKMHAESAQKANKPVILEEFGLSHKNCNIISQSDKSARDPYYQKWLDLIDGTSFDEKYLYQGFTYWMIGSRGSDSQGFPNGYYPDWDGYTIYGNAEDDEKENPNSDAREIIINAAKNMNSRNKVNEFTPDKVSFDSTTATGDLTASVTMYSGTLTGALQLDGKNLVKGTDYTYSNNTFTLKKSYLSSLKADTYTFTAPISGDGATPELTVNVGVVNGASLSPSSADIDKNTKKCKDVSINVTFKNSSDSVRNVKYNGKDLTKDVDYIVSGNTVVLKKSFLKTVADKKSTVTLIFNTACPVDFTINATDTTGLDELDSFESYNSSDDLWGTYSRNQGGNEVSLSVANKNGSKALSFGYKVDSPDYCGVTKNLGGKNFSSFKGIALWVEGDGSGNSLTIQLKDNNGTYKEKNITLDFTGGKNIFVPFSDFKDPSWQSNGDLNTSSISEYSIYMGSGGNTTSGTIYLDNIYAADGTNDDNVVVDLADCTVTLDRTQATFNGGEIKPVVTVKDGSTTLKNGTDYTVTYANNAKVGTATVTVTGIGDYEGTVTRTFQIVSKSLEYCDVSLSAEQMTFNGQELKPKVTVKISGKTVYSGNYTVSYANNAKVGTATVTIKGKGSLTGTVTKTFKIVSKSLKYCDVSLSGTSFSYTGSAIKPKVTVKILGKSVYNGNYTVTYTNNVNKGTATVVIKGKNSLTGSVTKTFTIK